MLWFGEGLGGRSDCKIEVVDSSRWTSEFGEGLGGRSDCKIEVVDSSRWTSESIVKK